MLKPLIFKQNDIYQYLCYEYLQVKDTVNFEKTLEEGMAKFPDEEYFLMNLINNYIYSGRNEKAVEYLNTAIAKDPNNSQLYHVMGIVHETGLKDYANAEGFFSKALELNPESIDHCLLLDCILPPGCKQQVKRLINDSKKYQKN